MKIKVLVLALAAGAVVAANAQQPKPEDQLKLRKAAYALLNYGFGPLAQMAEGKRPYSKEEAIRRADFIAQIAPVPKGLFGEGTDKVGETRAKPEIWTNRADFDAKMDKMVSEVTKLPQVARNGDEATVKKAIKDIDDACNACHEDYRQKRR
jgi:cytochrome c556